MRSITSGLEPRQLSDPTVIPAVWGVLEIPQEMGPRPGVILLTGSSGWHAEFVDIAKSLADAGFVALALDYLSETGRDPSHEERLQHLTLWQATLRNAVTYLQGSPFVSGRPIGLIGISLGAFLALSIASALPEVRGVLDFYGWMEPLGDQVSHLPPLLILHGEADSDIPVSYAYQLRDAVTAGGGEVEMHIYPGAEHAFNNPSSPTYSEPEAADSLRRTIEFLSRRLGK